jgi:hypothetical protein
MHRRALLECLLLHAIDEIRHPLAVWSVNVPLHIFVAALRTILRICLEIIGSPFIRQKALPAHELESRSLALVEEFGDEALTFEISLAEFRLVEEAATDLKLAQAGHRREPFRYLPVEEALIQRHECQVPAVRYRVWYGAADWGVVHVQLLEECRGCNLMKETA